MFLPVHPPYYPEGLEDNYVLLMDNVIGSGGSHERIWGEHRKRNSTLLGIGTLMTTVVTQSQIPL